MQCLLQKRGLNSASPNKWSFPGGRLENPGDLDEDGDVGTRRELEEECGGGEPLGLPSLIHIECYKSGKVSSLLFNWYYTAPEMLIEALENHNVFVSFCYFTEHLTCVVLHSKHAFVPQEYFLPDVVGGSLPKVKVEKFDASVYIIY